MAAESVAALSEATCDKIRLALHDNCGATNPGLIVMPGLYGFDQVGESIDGIDAVIEQPRAPPRSLFSLFAAGKGLLYGSHGGFAFQESLVENIGPRVGRTFLQEKHH